MQTQLAMKGVLACDIFTQQLIAMSAQKTVPCDSTSCSPGKTLMPHLAAHASLRLALAWGDLRLTRFLVWPEVLRLHLQVLQTHEQCYRCLAALRAKCDLK